MDTRFLLRFSTRLSLIVLLMQLSLQAHAQAFTESNLPIVVIDNGGLPIPDEPKMPAYMRIVDHPGGQLNHPGDPGDTYDGNIGIEIRGASSAWYPQTPYAITTRDSAGADQNVHLFGFPKEHDFCLLSFWNDKGLLRNPLAFKISQEMGDYAPRFRWVELVLNGQYEGIYLFCEKIKRDKHRVDIAKLDTGDVAGVSLTGGYMFKTDYWTGSDSWTGTHHPIDHPDVSYQWVYYYPKPEDLVPAQAAYLQQYVDQAENALYSPDFDHPDVGWRQYIDPASFIDYLIVNELSRNNDGYKKSCFYYKDRDDKDGRIKMGPVWDFDWAWKNIDECPMYAATDGSGWSYKINDCGPDVNSPGWVVRLMQDASFKQDLRCRWQSLRDSTLNKSYLFAYIDSVALYLEAAQLRHFQRWQILGQDNGAPEPPPYPTTYAGEVSKLKNWIAIRLNWLDAHVPGACPVSATHDTAENDRSWSLSPNPAADYLEVRFTGKIPLESLKVFDALGRGIPVGVLSTGEQSFKLKTQELRPGVYLILLGNQAARFVKQ